MRLFMCREDQNENEKRLKESSSLSYPGGKHTEQVASM